MLRRMTLFVPALVLGPALSGALYQTLSVRSEARRYPPPGRLIRVSAERRLHLVCLGKGEPTVIFESNGFGGALSAAAAREEVSTHTRVCSYDRMGMGWSDPANSEIAGRVAPQITWKHVEAACLAKIAARFGVLRLLDPFGIRGQPPVVATLYRVDPMATFCGVARGYRETVRELSAAPPLNPGIPPVVLVAVAEAVIGMLQR